MMRLKYKKAFTLIEILIVVGILGILSALLLANVSSGRERARDAVRKSDLDNIRKALRLYYNDYQSYPADNGSGVIMGCGDDGNLACNWGESGLVAGTNDTEYMKRLPEGPTGGEYTYTQTPGGEGFLIEVVLENAGDEAIAKSQSRCGVSLADDVYVACEK